ncbi:uncharacterized protein LOC125654526 [Ostrea edulis]|uniref:uncharacterized protein LOC125654526 n=1 Tax=Ostrea edulis TaxID=37623 RepID=UPI0024AF49CE|nr:uncharacterized protein LOC125654526 [Ostrea edulis]
MFYVKKMQFQKIIVVFIVILETYHCVELPDNACTASLETLKDVSKCPSNEKEYRDAARRKNCSAYSNACRSFEYHCVLNEWATSLVEVCAPSRLILSGKCTEFNRGLHCIRRSYLTDCKKFSKPCPLVYDSTQSFLYPGCYNIVSTATKESTELSTAKYSTAGTTIGDIRNQKQRKKESNLEGGVLMIALPIACLAWIAAVVIIFVIYFKWKKSISNRSKQKLTRKLNTDSSSNDTQEALIKGSN